MSECHIYGNHMSRLNWFFTWLNSMSCRGSFNAIRKNKIPMKISEFTVCKRVGVQQKVQVDLCIHQRLRSACAAMHSD